jgi:hypothetical protein
MRYVPTTTEIQDDLRIKVKNLEGGWKKLRKNSVSPITGRKKDEFDYKVKGFAK